jgi:hypothetical protein
MKITTGSENMGRMEVVRLNLWQKKFTISNLLKL